jgi:hypothetical protein
MKQVTISLPVHVVTELNNISALRKCSLEVLINSALAEWLNDYFYRGGQPMPFLEICKKIGIDCLMSSGDHEILSCYYAGVFGPPEEAGDTSFWSDPPFGWALKMRLRYKNY